MNTFTIRLGTTLPGGLQEFELRNVRTGATYTIYGAVTKQSMAKQQEPPVALIEYEEQELRVA